MGEALDADPAIVLQAAGLQPLAAAILGQVVAALAGRAAIIVVALALLDDALVVLEGEGLVALGAGVVGLLHLAPQQVVVLAFVEDEGVLRHAAPAGVVGVVDFTELYSGEAGAGGFDEAVSAVAAGAVGGALEAADVFGWVGSKGVKDVAFPIDQLIL